MRFLTFLSKNLFRRRMRTVLTCCGVAVAVGTTIALLGISEGFERSMIQSFEGRNVDAVVLQAGVLDQLTSDLPVSSRARIESVPGVGASAPGLLDIVSYSMPDTDITMVVQGWDPTSFLMEDLKFVDGRPIQQDGGADVMLGKLLSELIDKKVGDTIEIETTQFNVVGIFDSFNLQENRCAIMTLSEMQKLLFRENRVTGFSVRLADPGASKAEVDRICQAINELTDESGKNLDLAAMQTDDYVSNSFHIRMAHSMAWLTSVIAISVGAIGVLNTMIMSVVERVREISILRAIGWRKSRVIRMILGESVLLSLTGAVIGTIGAILLTKWLTTLPQASGYIEEHIALTTIAKGFLLAILVGVLGGLYPSYRAATLLPSEGLRHE